MAVTRPTFIHRLGVAGLAAAAPPSLWFQADAFASVSPEQLHLQFGSDASSQVVASWVTAGAVRHPDSG